MNKIEVTDKMLYESYPKVEEYLLNELPNEDEIEYVFSEVFEMKMKKLIAENKRPKFLNKINEHSKKIVVFFIVITISLFTITMSVEALRTQLFDLIKNVYEKFTLYQINIKEDTSSEKNSIKTPTYIPNGFNVVNKTEENGDTYLTYSNEFDYITFSSFKHTDTNLYLDTENTKITKVMINGIEAEYIIKNKNYKLVWSDSDNLYILTLEYVDASKLTNIKNELIKIAESVK